MKLNKILLSLFVIALSAGFVSCSDDDDDIFEITLEKDVDTLLVGQKSTIKITGGNGEYTVSSDKKEIADATVSKNEITIEAKATGSAIITVKDKENKTATIKIEVYDITGEWKINKESLDIEGKDLEGIKESYEGNGVKSLTLNEDGSFVTVIYDEDEEKDMDYKGTYTYSDEKLTLTFEDSNGDGVSDDPYDLSFDVKELTRTSLVLNEDLTEEYQENNEDAGVTKAIEITSFTRK